MRPPPLRVAICIACLSVSLPLLSACAPAPARAPAASPTPAATPTPAPTPIAVPDGWKLVWHDEFDAPEIDRANWNFDEGAGGWGNGEAQFYTSRPENARIESGVLIIEARQEKYEGSYYTSARLKTQDLREFQYGRIEARLKVPSGAGTWPAFWMLGSSFNGKNWPDCGEIDIMEYVGREPDLVIGTAHGPGYSGALGLSKWNRQEYNISDAFHTYAIEWQPGQVQWYYDGAEYFTVTRADVGDREWVFDQPFFVILNLAIGGTLGGTIGLDTKFPKQFEVDYVRVFQPSGS
jgi:beta-glucanase (GH16 family)